MKKYLLFAMSTALVLGVGFFYVGKVQAAHGSDHSARDAKQLQDLKARQSSSVSEKNAKHATDVELIHANFNFNLEKKHELERVNHALDNGAPRNLDKATFSSELAVLKTKIEADTTSADLDTDGDALTNLIAPKQE